MIAADPAPPPSAEAVVISRRDGTEVVAALDTPLVLTKAGQREQAIVRQAIFVTTSLSLTRPAKGDALDAWRWTHQAFLQRQVCFSSITGQFACAEASVQPLPNAEKGEAPVSPVDPQAAPESEAARKRLADGLKPRAAALFEADRKQHVDPMLKAAGVVTVRR